MASTMTAGEIRGLCDRLQAVIPGVQFGPGGVARTTYQAEVARLVKGVGAETYLAVLDDLRRRERAAYGSHQRSRRVTGQRAYVPGSVAAIDRGSWSAGPDAGAQEAWQRLAGLVRLLEPAEAGCRAALGG
jgi:hypothetical protein